MSKSTENSKKGSSKDVDKAIGRLKADKFNSSDDEKTQVGTSTRASVLWRTSVTRMKNLKKKKPTDETWSEADDDYGSGKKHKKGGLNWISKVKSFLKPTLSNNNMNNKNNTIIFILVCC